MIVDTNLPQKGGSGENKLNQLATKTITTVTAKDLEGAIPSTNFQLYSYSIYPFAIRPYAPL